MTKEEEVIPLNFEKMFQKVRNRLVLSGDSFRIGNFLVSILSPQSP